MSTPESRADLREMTVEQLGEVAILPSQLRIELCRAIQQSLESVLESVGDTCPECDSSLDRPKCLWELGGSCPRHEVNHIKRDHPKRIAELGDEIAALTTATAAADELLHRLSEMERLLVEHEYKPPYDTEGTILDPDDPEDHECLDCGAYRSTGVHMPSCRLALLLHRPMMEPTP